MILESLKPDSVLALCEQLTEQLTHLENEHAQYEEALRGDLTTSQRNFLEGLRTEHIRKISHLRERLTFLESARYNDDDDAVWNRTIRVA